MSDKAIEFSINNKLEDASLAIERLEKFMLEHTVPNELINKILLCMDELVTNIITHAYPDSSDRKISIECALSDTDITIEIHDDGVPFDPTKSAKPNINLPLAERPVGGLGIHLVRNIMDMVQYQRDGNFNILKISKSLN